MYVIGTAGHVDHGKSTLVKALTGIDPDRLQEEKAREMTIDLGFAHLTLPGGRDISIIDVPGHERFIKNMLAGVGGFDAALLVIAADEGVMPQTEEHVGILKVLGIDRGVVVLTKIDMVDDEWLGLMREEVRERLVALGSPFAAQPMVGVSARTGVGLTDLLGALDAELTHAAPRPDRGKPRLPVDRAFSISGFGTVATGTLIDGRLSVGQEVELQPGGVRSRIRSIQMHNARADLAPPGNRVAVNLVGLGVEDVRRGMVVTTPGWLTASDRLDVRLRLLPDAGANVEQNGHYDLFIGASEASANVTLLDAETLAPGESGLLQLRLSTPVAVARGDRFILRLPSPSRTLGGGVVLETLPRRHKRFHPPTIAALETLERGAPEEVLLQALLAPGLPKMPDGIVPRDLKALTANTGLPPDVAGEAAIRLVRDGDALLLGDDALTLEATIKAASHADIALPSLAPAHLLIATLGWQRLRDRATALVGGFHSQNPMRSGLGREELKSKLGIAAPKAFAFAIARLVAERMLIEESSVEAALPGENVSPPLVLYRLPDHSPRYTPAQQKQVDALLQAHAAAPFSPPAPSELGVDADVLLSLVEAGKLKRLAENIYFTPDAYRQMAARVLALIDARGSVTVADVRDELGSSRKYVLTLLGHLDEIKLTRRDGDDRRRW